MNQRQITRKVSAYREVRVQGHFYQVSAEPGQLLTLEVDEHPEGVPTVRVDGRALPEVVFDSFGFRVGARRFGEESRCEA